MAISKKKANTVKAYAFGHGQEKAAKKFGISTESVARYCNLANQTPELKVHTENEQDAPTYLADIKPQQRNPEHNRILIIGDLHTPFDYEPYFDHCYAVFDKYECNKVVFIGDIIDNHYSSYHETDADGLGGQDELDLAISRLARWNEAFPVADVIIGNHDRMVMRKAQSSSIPTKWIRDYKEVLDVPRWNFTDRVVYDKVQYIHGEGGTARTRCKKDLMSTVQGHLHTQCYVDWFIGAGIKVFGMQVGCGIDKDAYAFGYAKNFPNPALACGVVLNGKIAINEVLSINKEG